MSTKPKKRGGQRVSVAEPAHSLDDLEYWRKQVKLMLPEVDDAIELGEVSMIMRGVARQLSKHWKKFSSIVKKSDDSSGGLGIGIQVDRRTNPPEIIVKSSYSEKYGDSVKAKVPDPNVMELPFGQDTIVDDAESGQDGEAVAGEQRELTDGKE